jgi:hypothetical protein
MVEVEQYSDYFYFLLFTFHFSQLNKKVHVT